MSSCQIFNLKKDCLLFIFEVAFESALELLLEQISFVVMLNFDVGNLFHEVGFFHIGIFHENALELQIFLEQLVVLGVSGANF
jgi:hypothetical protein